ncbi:hypothetical protein L228DRAFT_266185 [Xylona heveae TC161]|uniref:Uncharacterized protein n=1 Tax=Xylona heveae (strain CBS 132557 / TC161) TaxID=1328760 RepID=A0A165J4Q1_XYLHT|nr:hypothetical protein L228DRAFT_266185 [Xylona heveae TC161]KZF25729.1 hypothetical protein L228DRAFT_266185 [Xylona heveae TC161]
MPSATPRRGFLASVRNFVAEPHPHARRPVSQAAHSVQSSVYLRRVGRTGIAYVPAAAVLLGWPILAHALLKERV